MIGREWCATMPVALAEILMETLLLPLDFISCDVKFCSMPGSILIQNLMMFSSMFYLNTNFSQCNHSLGYSVRAGLSCLQRLSIMIENQNKRTGQKVIDVLECVPVFLRFRCICQSCLPQIFVDQTNILAADRGGYFGR